MGTRLEAPVQVSFRCPRCARRPPSERLPVAAPGRVNGLDLEQIRLRVAEEGMREWEADAAVADALDQLRVLAAPKALPARPCECERPFGDCTGTCLRCGCCPRP